jgi:hypothetical protein
MNLKKLLTALFSLSLFVGAQACKKDSDAENAIEDATDAAGDAAHDAGDAIDDAAKDATE